VIRGSRRRAKKFKRVRNFQKFPLKKTIIGFGIGLFLVFIVFVVTIVLSIRKSVGIGKPINTVIVYRDGLVFAGFDPSVNDLLLVKVPGNLMVNTAGGYGKYQLKNVYDLGENEKKADDLVKKTIMKNFHIPIHLVVDCRKISFNGESVGTSTFSCPKRRNLFSLVNLLYESIKSGGNTSTKDLKDYRAIVTDTTDDGFFELSDSIFDKLEFDFSQDMSLDQIVNVRLEIGNSSDLPEYLYDVIKIMGGRVVEGTSGKDVVSSGCAVFGDDKKFIEDVGRVFGCRVEYEEMVAKEARVSISESYLRSL